MSTYHCDASPKKIGLLLRSFPGFVLGVLLIVVQLLLPAAVLASPGARAADVGRDQTLDLVGVSVVRLLVTYTPTSSPVSRLPLTHGASRLLHLSETVASAPPGGVCTGLGVVIRSWQPGRTGELNSWVLTDGDLVNDQPLCGGITSSGGVSIQLATIQIFGSTTATGQQLAEISCNSGLPGLCSSGSASSSFPLKALCPLQTGCAHNLALLPLPTSYDLPAVGLATTAVASPGEMHGIELATSQGQLPASPAAPQASNFLVPCENTQCGGENVEPGMPLVNNAGQLVGLHLLNEVTPGSIDQIKSVLAAVNLLEPGNSQSQTGLLWQEGVKDYYQHQYSQAKQAFQQVLQRTRNQFKGAQEFLDLINSQSQSGGSGNAISGKTATGQAPAGIPLLAWLLGGVVLLLAVLLVVIMQTIGRAAARRRRELKEFRQDLEEAEHRSDLKIGPQRVHGSSPGEYQMASPPPAPMPAPMAMAAPPPAAQARVPEPRSAESSAQAAGPGYQCPHCHQPVSRDTERCPQCGWLLSPSASGLRLQAVAPEAFHNQAQASSPPMSPPSAPAVPGLSLSDQPTLAMMPPVASSSGEKTLPMRNRQRARPLQLVVGHRTDPGIKRRHKPNEDNLFAMRGWRRLQSQLQPYGFFVVADGMGGHANGQDASFLAIQTIVDYVLPSLGQERDWTSDEYQRLLVDGVQSANQAVHERNQRERADMGTTMTTALIIGSSAYVANVGDSRTYLYREGVGLKKVTQDHSVVASLVDAGIIKPEDIYTHPKRNQIYRSLGEKPMVEVDPFREELLPGDKLLLCSDGLWDMTRDPNIEEVLKKPAEPQKLVNDLVQLALDGGGEDNISVIVVQLMEGGRQPAKPGVQILAKPDRLVMPELPQT
jgi:serine/threonine protein phosphatase PrpC